MSLSGLAHTESASAAATARYTPCAKQQQRQQQQRIVPFEQHVCATQFLLANSYRIIYGPVCVCVLSRMHLATDRR